jgi:hypothetical protein
VVTDEMGAIVTTFAYGSDKGCSLVKWCWNAHGVSAKLFNNKTDVVVWTDNMPAVQQLCPHAIIRPFDEALGAAKLAFDQAMSRQRGLSSNVVCSYTLWKFQALRATQYSTVLFLDADVDMSFGCVHPSSTTLDQLPQYLREFESSSCLLRATPDHSAIVNDGVMLLKPREALYQEVLSILRAGRFNMSHGHELAGRPKETIEITKAVNSVKRAMGYWKNTWNTVCAAGSQGLFAHLYLVRHRALCEPIDWWIRVRHFWGGEKPWKVVGLGPRSCSQYYAFPHHRPAACEQWLGGRARGRGKSVFGLPRQLKHPHVGASSKDHGRKLGAQATVRGLLAAAKCDLGRDWPIL